MAIATTTKLKTIFSYIPLLRDLIIFKTGGRPWLKHITVKARDLELIANVDHGDVVVFGKLLRKLTRHGLARMVTGTRPIKYELKGFLIYWAYHCSYPHCANDGSLCGLWGICPYHIIGGDEKSDGN